MRLAASDLAADADTLVYRVPPGERAVLTASLCNRSTTVVKVRLALTDGAAPTDADWIEYDQALAPSGVLERTGLALDAGQALYARASAAEISAVVFGIVERVA